jgi:hypothetical protein
MASPRTLGIEATFGVNRNQPASYVARSALDKQVKQALSTNGHVAICGESQQGKSLLLKRALDQTDHCTIQCTYGQKRYDIYRMLLREMGASVSIERKRKRSRGIKARISVLSGDLGSESEVAERAIDIDIGNINDVLSVARERNFDGIVVLEDFNFLAATTQRNVLRDLKVVYERSELRFVLLGTWLDSEWVRALSGRLSVPVVAIEVPAWSVEDLERVLVAGADHLGITFDADLVHELVRLSQGNVGLLQELACATVQHGLGEQGNRNISNLEVVGSAVAKIVQATDGRSCDYIREMSVNPRYLGVKPLGNFNIFKGILHAILKASDHEIRNGIAEVDVLERIMDIYKFEASDLPAAHLRYGLEHLEAIHRALEASPIVGYDSTRQTLRVVDAAVRLCWTAQRRDRYVEYLPNGGRDIESFDHSLARRVLARYGWRCAVCSVTDTTLLRTVSVAATRDHREEYWLSLCLTHAATWERGKFAFEPSSTRVLCEDPRPLGITETDLSHLPAQPSRQALTERTLAIAERAPWARVPGLALTTAAKPDT